jgi:uncharacterized protein (DUF433 family)
MNKSQPPKNQAAARERLREQLAALCHEQWSGWMRYLFENCSLIPEAFAIRWKRQMNTPYAELSEAEKESDRKEADRFLSLLQQPVTSERCGESILRPLCAEHPSIRFVDGVLGGVQPLIEGHRVGVTHLLSRMAIGMSLAEYKETWGFDDETLKDAFAYAQDVIEALIDRERGVTANKPTQPKI